jgi:serine phosphatase RsbU (regulator of sigma subunit)
MLGMLESARVTDVTVDLEPGDVVVLYTDGITEARRAGEFFGDDRVARLIGDAGNLTAQELADALVSTAVEFQDGTTRDDIAVLVVRRPG